ncbi:MAG: aldo/keto reductase [Opitutaceae bacterium]|nr:aldo/keto reductase [Opitutaceae bacterium]
MMNLRPLGCTSLKVSELCLGTMNFGWRTDEATSLSLLDAFHASGGNFIQSLGVDAGPPASPISPSFSETVVGAWWQSRGIPRRDLVLATRISLSGKESADTSSLGARVRQLCESSLRRLRTDYLDVLVCEWTGTGNPPEALRRGLDWLVREGWVRYVAFSNIPAWRVAAGVRDGFERIHCRISAVQADYSLLSRVPFESGLSDLCSEERIGFFARAPLAGGLLTRPSESGRTLSPARRAWLGDRHGWDAVERVIQALGELAHDSGFTESQIALAWVLHHPGVTSLVMGVSSPGHLDDAVKASRIRLGADELRLLHHASRLQQIALPYQSSSPSRPPSIHRATPSPAELENV